MALSSLLGPGLNITFVARDVGAAALDVGVQCRTLGLIVLGVGAAALDPGAAVQDAGAVALGDRLAVLDLGLQDWTWGCRGCSAGAPVWGIRRGSAVRSADTTRQDPRSRVYSSYSNGCASAATRRQVKGGGARRGPRGVVTATARLARGKGRGGKGRPRRPRPTLAGADPDPGQTGPGAQVRAAR